MTGHPFAFAFQCARADVEEVPISLEHPSGLRFRSPCRCPHFLSVHTEVPDEARPTLRRALSVDGCFGNLFPWMQGALIQQANAASADREKNSGLVVDLASGVERELRKVGSELEGLRQAQVSTLGIMVGASVQAALPAALCGNSPLLLGEEEKV